MAIGRNRRALNAFTVTLFCIFVSSFVVSAAEKRTGIWKVLREGQFSGMMNEDARARPVGDLIAGKRYYLMDYAWEESPKNMQADFSHAQYRLLVFERSGKDLTYLGSYITKGGRPHIKGKTVIFPYKDYKVLEWKTAKAIVFDENGPPKKAVLDGELFGFSR